MVGHYHHFVQTDKRKMSRCAPTYVVGDFVPIFLGNFSQIVQYYFIMTFLSFYFQKNLNFDNEYLTIKL